VRAGEVPEPLLAESAIHVVVTATAVALDLHDGFPPWRTGSATSEMLHIATFPSIVQEQCQSLRAAP